MVVPVPIRISGESVEDIASQLYDSLNSRHTSESFKLEYMVINDAILSEEGREQKTFSVDSKDDFIDAFLQYAREGRCILSGNSDFDKVSSSPMITPSELSIYCKKNGQYSDQYYSIEKGVENAKGLIYYGNLIKRALLNSKPVQRFRDNFLTQGKGIDSLLNRGLNMASQAVLAVEKNQFYITIKQKTRLI